MASQAYLDAINGKQGGVTRQSILDDIYQATKDYENALIQSDNATPLGGGGIDAFSRSNSIRNQALYAKERQNQLKYLLNAGTNSGAWNEDGSTGGGGGGGGNPFSAGGSGAPTLSQSNAFGAAPTLNTSNRFEPGLSDAESRLKNLLDNPDSIQQSAAYKFRVAQGQEALQRSLGARGLLNSGNRLMELTKYGQDMGSQEYDAQYGRLGNLLNTQQQGWLGDKNANTAQFGAQSQAWLGDKNANTGLFSAQANAWNTAQGNADRNRLGYAEINAEINAANNRAALAANSGGRSGGNAWSGGSTSGLYQNSPAAQTDPWTAVIGSYDPNTGLSAYNNAKTGQQQMRY